MCAEEYDKNLVINSEFSDKEIVWSGVDNEIFDIYGLYNPRIKASFHRAPKSVR